VYRVYLFLSPYLSLVHPLCSCSRPRETVVTELYSPITRDKYNTRCHKHIHVKTSSPVNMTYVAGSICLQIIVRLTIISIYNIIHCVICKLSIISTHECRSSFLQSRFSHLFLLSNIKVPECLQIITRKINQRVEEAKYEALITQSHCVTFHAAALHRSSAESQLPVLLAHSSYLSQTNAETLKATPGEVDQPFFIPSFLSPAILTASNHRQ